MDFTIKDARPIWQQLTQQLKERIVTGQYELGARFPSVRELAAQAGVNPNTMQRALTQLETEGLVVTNRTAGRTVTEDTDTVENVRRALALERAKDYAQGMQTLGYSNEKAAAFLTEGLEENNG